MNFKKIGIIGRMSGGASVIETIRHLVSFLESKALDVSLDEKIAEFIPGIQCQLTSQQTIGETSDLVVVVGGDGSLLSASRVLADYSVPVLGINRGNFGFLTDVAPDQYERCIMEVLEGQYTLEERFLFDVNVYRGDEHVGSSTALNDCVLHPGKYRRMIPLELFIDDRFVYSQRSDGMIVATPTGSTAYALSGGGPIMQPSMDAVVIVPICPHTLSSRPIVVDGNSKVALHISNDCDTYPIVSCDGQNTIACAPGDVAVISKKDKRLKLLHPTQYDFFMACREKFSWGSRLSE